VRRRERIADVRDRLGARCPAGGAAGVARAVLGPSVDDEQAERDDRRDDREREEDRVYDDLTPPSAGVWSLGAHLHGDELEQGRV
jgi:hypothetical protein